MAGLWKRIFGSQKQPAAQAVSATETVAQESSKAESKRVGRIETPQFSPSLSPGVGGKAGDTGPWFIGKTVGEIYQIRGVLGRGGMGVVYRAYDTATHLDVAVKVPVGTFVNDPAARERFAREARIWLELLHPHIVHAFDVRDDETTEFRPAVFMDYCDGGSLAQRLSIVPRPSVPEALDIAIQVCWAMEFAHQFEYEHDGRKLRGLLHRDLKPGNVLLTTDGRAMVSDFGLVKQLSIEDLQSSDTQVDVAKQSLEGDLTHCAAVGTPEYMPPEQWSGNAFQQSDIYAFGVMLFELFCGVRPFTALPRSALRILHCHTPPPDPRTLNGELPSELAELIIECLAKEPCSRPADFGSVAARLESVPCQRRDQFLAQRNRPSQQKISQAAETTRAWASIRLAQGHYRRAEFAAAESHFRKASGVFRRFDDATGLSAALNGQAMILGIQGYPEKAIDLLQEAQRLCRKALIADPLQVTLGNMGVTLKNLGHLDGAMKCFQEGVAICQELGDQGALAGHLGNQALILKAHNNLAEAMRLHQEEERLSRAGEDWYGLAYSLGNQGLLLRAMNRLHEAMARHRDEEEILSQIGDDDGIQRSWGHQAMVLFCQRDFQGAMELLKRQETACRRLKNQRVLANCLANQAFVLANTGQLEQAIIETRKVQELFIELHDPKGHASSLANQAIWLHHLGRLHDARPLAEKALVLTKTYGLLSIQQTLEALLQQFH